jgi:hypothetical protein
MKPSEAITEKEYNQVITRASFHLAKIIELKNALIARVTLGGKIIGETHFNSLYIDRQKGLTAFSHTGTDISGDLEEFWPENIVRNFDLCDDHIVSITERLLATQS